MFLQWDAIIHVWLVWVENATIKAFLLIELIIAKG